MKKMLSHLAGNAFLKISVLFLFVSIHAPSSGQTTRIYEAEYAKISDSTKIMEDVTASGNRYLNFKQHSFIKWNVNSPSTGWYKISIRYRAPEGDAAKVLDVNGKIYGMGFSMCNNWSDSYFLSYLKQGPNVISVYPDYGNIQVDYLTMPGDSLFLPPMISPVRNTFYKEHPATITILADAKGRKLQAVKCCSKQIDFLTKAFPHVEGAFDVVLSTENLMSLPIGDNQLLFEFNDGTLATFDLQIKERIHPAGLTLIMPYVEHGNAVIVILPGGRKLLIDSGKDTYARTVLMPLMDQIGVDTLDYYVITHYHDDHVGALDEIRRKYNVRHFYDYKSFNRGDTTHWGRAVVTILNAFADGTSENERSLSFLLNWNGFTYSHGADNYAHNQDEMLDEFGNALAADVFYANHHFHGSVNPDFIIRTNPALVVVSAQQAVYARGAFADVYREKTEKVLYAAHARLIETLLTLETGTVVVRVNGPDDWNYETYREHKDIFIPDNRFD
jgi:beta-lactamase superfamily II metal-dependent hydrolase